MTSPVRAREVQIRVPSATARLEALVVLLPAFERDTEYVLSLKSEEPREASQESGADHNEDKENAGLKRKRDEPSSDSTKRPRLAAESLNALPSGPVARDQDDVTHVSDSEPARAALAAMGELSATVTEPESLAHWIPTDLTVVSAKEVADYVTSLHARIYKLEKERSDRQKREHEKYELLKEKLMALLRD